ncbi:hypothetical protein N7467_007453 [Penicillium canescens]|nr:hypothetical protein N7467_007453 [Penicillium canescens]
MEEMKGEVQGEGYTAEAIASALLGLFRLGFLLDFIPLPVLSGYVSAAAITIVLQQLKELFGESKKGSSTAAVIREFFKQLPDRNWRAFLVGISCIVLLLSLQFVGRKWGKKYRAVSRRSDPLFGISKVKSTGIIPPKQLDSVLLLKVAGRSVVVFLAAALEHLAIGKAFGRRHGYVIEQDQELSYIGLVNMFGSFFSSMPVTGGFSRTAVNSESGVKSPLSGLATTACVLVSIYKLSDAFYWIPSATVKSAKEVFQ